MNIFLAWSLQLIFINFSYHSLLDNKVSNIENFVSRYIIFSIQPHSKYFQRLPKKILFTGDTEITWCPPQLALDLYGEDAWVDLGLRYNSCYIDVEYCNQTGLTVAFWVTFREAKTMQGLIEFGSGDCGLSVIRTNDSEIKATLKSVGLGRTWSVGSVNASLVEGTWHHVTLTWNSTGEVNLFINGTRYTLIFSFVS